MPHARSSGGLKKQQQRDVSRWHRARASVQCSSLEGDGSSLPLAQVHAAVVGAFPVVHGQVGDGDGFSSPTMDSFEDGGSVCADHVGDDFSPALVTSGASNAVGDVLSLPRSRWADVRDDNSVGSSFDHGDISFGVWEAFGLDAETLLDAEYGSHNFVRIGMEDAEHGPLFDPAGTFLQHDFAAMDPPTELLEEGKDGDEPAADFLQDDVIWQRDAFFPPAGIGIADVASLEGAPAASLQHRFVLRYIDGHLLVPVLDIADIRAFAKAALTTVFAKCEQKLRIDAFQGQVVRLEGQLEWRDALLTQLNKRIAIVGVGMEQEQDSWCQLPLFAPAVPCLSGDGDITASLPHDGGAAVDFDDGNISLGSSVGADHCSEDSFACDRKVLGPVLESGGKRAVAPRHAGGNSLYEFGGSGGDLGHSQAGHSHLGHSDKEWAHDPTAFDDDSAEEEYRNEGVPSDYTDSEWMQWFWDKNADLKCHVRDLTQELENVELRHADVATANEKQVFQFLEVASQTLEAMGQIGYKDELAAQLRTCSVYDRPALSDILGNLMDGAWTIVEKKNEELVQVNAELGTLKAVNSRLITKTREQAIIARETYFSWLLEVVSNSNHLEIFTALDLHVSSPSVDNECFLLDASEGQDDGSLQENRDDSSLHNNRKQKRKRPGKKERGESFCIGSGDKPAKVDDDTGIENFDLGSGVQPATFAGIASSTAVDNDI